MGDARKIILVEGPDDMHAVAGFFRKDGLTKRIGGGANELNLVWSGNGASVDIHTAGGDSKVQDFKETLNKLNVFKSAEAVALIVDADDNFAGKWVSIKTKLQSDGYNIPYELDKCGGVFAAPKDRMPQIGVWIMPDNSGSGMLETFLSYCVREGDGVWNEAESKTADIKERYAEEQRFKDVHLDKAKMHSYLAWKEPPGIPLGQAIVKGVLDNNAELAQYFMGWISRTLNLN